MTDQTNTIDGGGCSISITDGVVTILADKVVLKGIHPASFYRAENGVVTVSSYVVPADVDLSVLKEDLECQIVQTIRSAQVRRAL